MLQNLGPNNDYLLYDKGKAPRLENEIALSEAVLKENKWNIGDWVDVNIGGKAEKFIITGTYTDYMQMGQSGRLNPAIDMKEEMMADYWNILVDMKTDMTQKELAHDLKKDFPSYEWNDAQSLVDQNVGGTGRSGSTITGEMDPRLIRMRSSLWRQGHKGPVIQASSVRQPLQAHHPLSRNVSYHLCIFHSIRPSGARKERSQPDRGRQRPRLLQSASPFPESGRKQGFLIMAAGS